MHVPVCVYMWLRVCVSMCLSVGYSVSKVGVTKLAMIQARELKSDHRPGILVNAVSQMHNSLALCVCVCVVH